jgi:hypothetical protein
MEDVLGLIAGVIGLIALGGVAMLVQFGGSIKSPTQRTNLPQIVGGENNQKQSKIDSPAETEAVCVSLMVRESSLPDLSREDRIKAEFTRLSETLDEEFMFNTYMNSVYDQRKSSLENELYGVTFAFTYTDRAGNTSERIVTSIDAVQYASNQIAILCFCHNSQDVRNFFVSRMQDVIGPEGREVEAILFFSMNIKIPELPGQLPPPEKSRKGKEDFDDLIVKKETVDHSLITGEVPRHFSHMGNYVYLHRDSFGKVFFVGRGSHNTAWRTDRDEIWHRYLERKGGGKFSVEIVGEQMRVSDAESFKQELIAADDGELINWSGKGRRTNYAALEAVNSKSKESKRLNDEAKRICRTDPKRGLELTKQALKLVYEYSDPGLKTETGIVVELMDKPRRGDLDVVYRMVQCLKELDMFSEIVDAVDQYFDDFPYERTMSLGKRIIKLRNTAAIDAGLPIITLRVITESGV